MEATESNFKVKLAQLQLTTKRTDNIIASGKHEAIQRQCQTLSTISNEINVMRITVEAEKIGMKVGVEEIVEWNNDIETKLDEADKEIEKARKWIGDYKKKAEAEAQEEELKFQEKLHQTKLKYEAELQAAKSTQSQHEPGESTTSAVGAKLPKLVISKFNGTYMDWPRFWGQFTETIDKSNIAAVSKFAYLRELLDSKVKNTIEALPFTAEGYNRAKSILQEKYGKETEIVKAYCREILDLPTVTSANPRKIADFSDKLQYCVHALQTMKKLDQVNGAVALTLEKLPAIRGDIVRTDPDWECWNFAQLSEAIRLWTRRNPVESKQEHEPVERRHEKPRKLFHAQGKQEKPRACVYCDDPAHKTVNCTKVTSLPERRQILIRKRLCFNCAAGMHKSVTCPSKASCQHCHLRHHSSLHDSETDVKLPNGKNVAMTSSSNDKKEGIFPVVVVDVNGIRCRALIDSGSGSSYVSTKLIQLLGAKPTETQTRTVDMLMASKVTQLEIYDLEFRSVNDQFVLPVRATKVNKAELLTMENPKYGELIDNYPHLKGVSVNDDYTKPVLPIHVVLGGVEYAKIKTQTKPRIGQQNEPVAELTKFGWFVMSPGTEIEKSTMMLTQASQRDYEDLCRLDVLGLADAPEHDQNTVHAEFKEQLERSPEGWYETGLPWKSNHPELLDNKQGSLNRLENLSRRLERKGQTSEYDGIIKEQIEMNIVERAPEKVSGKEFYIPHKPVVRETAATTKMRVVYDASAHPTPDSVSLSECLNPGPPLQNKLWDVLVRQRAFPVAVNADLRRAFLQIRVKEADRDALRFHWRSSAEEEVETWRFTRVLFGLAPSPFLLNGVLEAHLDAWEERQPDVVAELRKSLYVDDVISGNQTVEQAQRTKQVAIEIMSHATFELHKWNSNEPQLEDNDNRTSDSDEQFFAKQQLNVKPTESKMLGLKWDKHQDTLAVMIPTEQAKPTKRGILGKLASIYDPLGLIAPLTLTGKQIYRDVCEAKKPWDALLNNEHLKRWRRWELQLPSEQQVPRPIVHYREKVQEVELHSFGDASISGVGAAVYAVVRQESGTTQRLVAAKGRLAKQNLTIPRLELVGAHMATNLLINVRNAYDNLPPPMLYGWLDSTVALHWIKGNGQYKQFVANRVAKIRLHKDIEWRYVPTDNNPADLASRGAQVEESQLWWTGPEWLCDHDKWPKNPVTKNSPASEAEMKMNQACKTHREVLNIAQDQPKPEPNVFDNLLERHDLRRALRIQAWVLRFTTNRHRKGPLTSEDLQEVRHWWIKRGQTRG